jgi:hypothetical protein
MNWKVLLKAMKFSLLPTLLTFTLLFLGFMSFTDAFNFLTSNNGWSIFVRISLFIAEMSLIFYMYKRYEIDYLNELKIQEEKERKAKKLNSMTELPVKIFPNSSISYPDYKELRDIFECETGYFKFYKTDNDNYILLQRNV